jgi:TRAP-type uncharacterized transport system fused permease subunit
MEQMTLNQRKDFKSIVLLILNIICVFMAVFQLGAILYGHMPASQLRAVHVGCVICIASLTEMMRKETGNWRKILDGLIVISMIIVAAYVFLFWKGMQLRVASPYVYEVILGCILTFSLLYCCKRTMGWALPIICIVFLLYAYFGKYMPHAIAHRGYNITRIMSQLFEAMRAYTEHCAASRPPIYSYSYFSVQ